MAGQYIGKPGKLHNRARWSGRQRIYSDEQVVEVMNREHTQQVLDRNETIRQLIVRKNDSFFSKAMEMLESYNAIRST